VSAQQQHQQTAAVAFTTAGPGQEMLVHFNFNKDREGLFRPEEHAALQRYVSSQYSCFCCNFFNYRIYACISRTKFYLCERKIFTIAFAALWLLLAAFTAICQCCHGLPTSGNRWCRLLSCNQNKLIHW
jgi:hypothetical protein